MHNDLLMAKDHLIKNGHKIVAVKNGEIIFTSDDSGIKGLLNALDENSDILLNSSIADKVVGRAAALLFSFGNISRVFTPVISNGAYQALLDGNIEAHFGKKVDFIMNRSGDDMCPMEKKCQNINDPEEAFKTLSGFIKGGKTT